MCSLSGRDKQRLPGKGWNVTFQKPSAASILLSFPFLCTPGKTPTNAQRFQKIRTIAKSSTASPVSKSLLKNDAAVGLLFLACEESTSITVKGSFWLSIGVDIGQQGKGICHLADVEELTTQAREMQGNIYSPGPCKRKIYLKNRSVSLCLCLSINVIVL